MTHWQSVNYIDEWERAGCLVEIIEVNYEDSSRAKEVVLTTVRDSSCDVFISACDDNVLEAAILDEVRKKGVPSLLICFDNLSVPYKHKECCRFFDLVWLTSSDTKYLFDKWGARTVFMPYAANPFKYKPSNANEIQGMGFVGTCYGGRVNKIEAILEMGIDVRLYGGNSPAVEGENPARNLLNNLSVSLSNVANLLAFPIGRKALMAAAIKTTKKFEISNNLQKLISERVSLSFEEVSEIYSRSMFSLNITELWNTYLLDEPVHKLHLRTFEIPMSGGFQVASRTEEIQSYFEEDKEILLYDSMEELVEKTGFYMKAENAGLREEIKRSARKRAASEHTWNKRFDNVFSVLGV